MSNQTRNIWKNVDAVCFDVDSTVIKEEGIDELAKFCNKNDEVSKLTKKAMAGSMTFQEALKLRLDIIQPTHAQVQQFIKTKPANITSGIKELITQLQKRDVPVYLVSGGFRSIIEPVAAKLNIPVTNIFANRLIFYFNGEYANFDETQLTSRSGGKGAVIQKLKNENGFKNLVMIGDGITDFEACPPADAFIGFGGNVIREPVKEKSEWFVTDFEELINNL